jgi:threonine aldolase
MIDLRSDTVTRPTQAMRQAMLTAEVGDDVYGEDPTVNRLEARAAELTGKEAALFVPSGTMGNTIGIKILTEHGQEVICERRAHILNYELAMLGWFSGCVTRVVEGERGVLQWADIKKEIRSLSLSASATGAVEIENTANIAGGTVYPLEVVREICDGAHAAGLRVHMDGARVFNAAEALGASVKEICAGPDTVMFCLSKALGAPVGSLLAGPRELIARGRQHRKRLGGGMRQAGVLGAAGLVALEESPKGLAADHANARYLADGLAEVEGVAVEKAETNIVVFDVAGTGLTAKEVSARARQKGVLFNGIGATAMRMVTHYDVDRAGCERALEVVREVAR